MKWNVWKEIAESYEEIMEKYDEYWAENEEKAECEVSMKHEEGNERLIINLTSESSNQSGNGEKLKWPD